MERLEGKLTGQGLRVALVAARTNDFIVSHLVDGALDCLLRHGVADDNITLCRVPGCFEIPLAARKLAEQDRFDAVICLGAVIRGATPHFEYISAEVAKGAAQVAMTSGVPVLFGVLTTDTIEQAVERAGNKAGNKGFEAALAAIEMASLMDQLDR